MVVTRLPSGGRGLLVDGCIPVVDVVSSCREHRGQTFTPGLRLIIPRVDMGSSEGYVVRTLKGAIWAIQLARFTCSWFVCIVP